MQVRRFEDAESDVQIVVILPEQQTLVAFDLAFAPEDHVFTVTRHFENWLRILDELNAGSGLECIISGHGAPTHPSALAHTAAYLRTAREVFTRTGDAPTYAARMKAAFPARRHPGWIELASKLLYSDIDAYETRKHPDRRPA